MIDPDAHRPEFTRALRLLAEAFELARSKGADLPVIVDGAAVEYHTVSAVQSGDIGLVTAAEHILAPALEAVGFRPRVAGSLRNLIHPDLLLAVDFVSGRLFDGRTDLTHVDVVHLDASGARSVQFPPAEDMIADRLAQYESAPGGVPEMLDQARLLYRLVDDIDDAYPRRRVAEECSSVDLLSLLEAPL